MARKILLLSVLLLFLGSTSVYAYSKNMQVQANLRPTVNQGPQGYYVTNYNACYQKQLKIILQDRYPGTQNLAHLGGYGGVKSDGVTPKPVTTNGGHSPHQGSPMTFVAAEAAAKAALKKWSKDPC